MGKIENKIEKEENKIKLELKKTNLKKESFINEIKNGLGDEIKMNPNKFEVMVTPEPNKFTNFFRKIFKIFI